MLHQRDAGIARNYIFQALLSILVFVLVVDVPAVSAKLKRDAYATLKVAKNATQDEINKAYRALAKKYHPDINPDRADDFTEVAQAYEYLKDPEARAQYDKYGEDPPQQQQPDNNPFSQFMFRGGGNPFVFFEDFGGFHAQRGGPHSRRGSSHQTRQRPSMYADSSVTEVNAKQFTKTLDEAPWVTLINFYDPNCMLCAEFANDYKKLASRLEGIVQVIAVNCGADWRFCESVNVPHTPYFVLYTEHPDQKRLVYDGEVTSSSLRSWLVKATEFYGKRLRATTLEAWLDDDRLNVIYFPASKYIPLGIKKISYDFRDKIDMGVIESTDRQLLKLLPFAPTFPSVYYVTNPTTLQGEWLAEGQIMDSQLVNRFGRILAEKRAQDGRYGSFSPFRELTLKRFQNGDCSENDTRFCFIVFKYGEKATRNIDEVFSDLSYKYQKDPVRFFWVRADLQKSFATPFNLSSCNNSSSANACTNFLVFRPKRKAFKVYDSGALSDAISLRNFVDSALSGGLILTEKLKGTPKLLKLSPDDEL